MHIIDYPSRARHGVVVYPRHAFFKNKLYNGKIKFFLNIKAIRKYIASIINKN